MAFLIGGANSATGDFITNSLRFNDGDTASLSRSFGSSGNNKTFTFSCWIKFSDKKTGSSASDCCHGIFASEEDSGYQFFITTDEDQILRIADYQSEYKLHLQTNRRFRDCAAWYHLVVIFDTTQGTAADRCKVYINGQKQTSFSTAVYPDQNQDLYGNENNTHYIGRRGGSNTMYFDGYIAEVNFVDGTAVAATSFGEVDDNGVWVPIEYTGSHGTQGFYLQFKQTGTSANSSGMGADTSGNDLHFTCTNLAATDITTDTPMNNFSTMNPLVYPYANITYSEGNLKLLTGNSENSFTTNTMAPANGKWYTEIKVTDVGSDALLGITRLPVPAGPNHYPGQQAYDVAYYSSNGQKATGGSFSSYGNSYTTNDIVGIAMDLDNDKVYFSKNGTWQNSGDPTSGATGTGAISIPSLTSEDFVFIAAGEWNGSDTSTFEVNFGNPTFSISSGNKDANGYGNFEYAPPSGYYAICSKNLAEYG